MFALFPVTQIAPLQFLAQTDSVHIFQAIADNDLMGKFCLLLLSALSLLSITLIIHKKLELWKAKHQTDAFQELVDKDGCWEVLFAASKKYPSSPIAHLLKEVYVECRLENWFRGKTGFTLENRLEIAKHTVEGSLLRTISEEETRLQSKLTMLATISTVGPFIGLFGTVWGVLAAFQSVGQEGGAALTALAPGISTALMTTIFGLVAATPALVSFNFFSRDINILSAAMESFSHDIDNAVRKQILLDEEKG